ncbi:hypothetical protein BDV95DRAFT_602481 [Massariosphaeria phaeospora]|uniref:Uncharacterized protein n=1 Tax=Massariosphaeria phaeospora TaxID=100035 RepID=A0A7C8MIR9_9PLEO|nr:hypothetical protein BDV95DRAFT_602481 [Massariosphaeria phaeospora]
MSGTTEMDIDTLPVIVQLPSTRPKSTKRDKNTVSKSWRWDVDATDLDIDDVATHFQQKTDLFAYHALPIAKQQLDPSATKKEIRGKIDAFLADMSETEHGKWEESFRKLRNGDAAMLDRIALDTPSNKRKAGMNPSPMSRSKATEHLRFPQSLASEGQCVNDHKNAGAGLADTPGAGHTRSLRLKEETNHENGHLPEASIGSARNEEADMTTDTTAFRHLSTEDVEPYIPIPRLDGTTKIQTKPQLKHALLKLLEKESCISSQVKLRKSFESQLLPWVVANHTSFAEFATHPFLFACMMPYITPATEVICGKDPLLAPSNSEDDMARILKALKRRGIPSGFLVRSHHDILPMDQQLAKLLRNVRSDVVKRTRLERLLRYVALAYRQEFPELKDCALVQTWERVSGLKW